MLDAHPHPSHPTRAHRTCASRRTYFVVCITVVFACLLTGCPLDTSNEAESDGQTSGIDRTDFDFRVRPQDDLYRAANGHWLDTTRIPEGFTSWGPFELVRQRTQAQLRAIAEEYAAAPGAAATRSQRIGDLYASLMDQSEIDASGLRSLQGVFDRIDAINSIAEGAPVLAYLQSIGVSMPVDVTALENGIDARGTMVSLEQGGLEPLTREAFFNMVHAHSAPTRAAFNAYVERCLALAHVPDAGALAPDVVTFMTHMAQAQWDKAALYDRQMSRNVYSPTAMQQTYAGFPFMEVVTAFGFPTIKDVINVAQPSYLADLDVLLHKLPPSTLRAYLKFATLNAYVPVLPAEFEAGQRELFPGPGAPRHELAMGLLDELIGADLGQEYAGRHFSPAHRMRIENMARHIRQAFRERIATRTWLSPRTREAALHKLDGMSVKIGYPDTSIQYDGLDIRRHDAAGNVMRVRRFAHDRLVTQFGKPRMRDDWDMHPQTVNAQYNPQRNEIIVPAAFLQPPLFIAQADEARNYGSIGTALAHEMGHGFDNAGSLFDATGAMRDWWTRADRERFEDRTYGLIAQYNRYSPLPGIYVDGRFTLGENIADLTGLSVALLGYRQSVQGKRANVIDGLTGEQRFYYGYAQGHRSLTDRIGLITQIATDVHAPADARINVPASNQTHFYDTFDVQPGDKLYRPATDRVTLW